MAFIADIENLCKEIQDQSATRADSDRFTKEYQKREDRWTITCFRLVIFANILIANPYKDDRVKTNALAKSLSKICQKLQLWTWVTSIVNNEEIKVDSFCFVIQDIVLEISNRHLLLQDQNPT